MDGDNMDCIFCKIVKGEIPCYKLYEDDVVLVFLDVNPKANGHTLIIPKQHTLDLMSIDNSILMHIMDIARKMSKLLEEKLNATGITLVQNNGTPQEVKHFHLHLVPTYANEQVIEEVQNIYEKLKKDA